MTSAQVTVVNAPHHAFHAAQQKCPHRTLEAAAMSAIMSLSSLDMLLKPAKRLPLAFGCTNSLVVSDSTFNRRRAAI